MNADFVDGTACELCASRANQRQITNVFSPVSRLVGASRHNVRGLLVNAIETISETDTGC